MYLRSASVFGWSYSVAGLLLAALYLLVPSSLAMARIRIGVVPSWQSVLTTALDSARTNLSIDLLPIEVEGTRSSYEAIDKTYKKVDDLDLHAVISPWDSAVGLATETLRVPYLATTHVSRRGLEFTSQVSPEIKRSSEAFLDISQVYRWKKVSVFYDSDDGIQVLEKLMTDHAMSVRAWRLPKKAGRRLIRDSLVEMRKVLVERSVVLCNKDNTYMLLDEARNLAMLSTPPHAWMFYDPGDEMKNIFNRYNDIAVNFTVLSLLPYNTSLIPKSKGHNYDLALAKDSLQLVTSLTSIIQESASKASITLTDKSYRNQLNLAIRNNEETGLTGYLEFNEHGRRQNYSLTLTTITGSHTYLRGYWYSLPYVLNKRLTLFDEKHPRNRTSPFPLRGRVAKVVMIQERPFTMLKRDHMLKRGNAKYEGFAVDLIREVAQMLEFDYEIYLVNDGKFGNKMPNGEWNGMIGELLAGNATMSVAPLSINAQREEAVDFTKPFKTRYISVLMRIPRRDRSYFEFLNPLSPIVWICTLGAFVIVSIILYTLERIGRGKDKGGTDALQITVRESFWFIFGSLLQGNTDSTPCTIPGRILTSAWWFFALILISSYTANLAAFLTVKKINTPINSVTDLAQQTKIKYGTVKDSGVMSFFKNTNIEHFTKMWAQMSELDPDSMVDNTTEGFKKVKDEDYAFFWDTTVNKYQTIMDCNMMEIGPAFDPKGFGIGVPPGATYREELSMAILQLSDRGRLHEIETKWWDSQCPEISKVSTDETSELQIENVAGVFFILVGGIIVAAIVCLGEYFANALINASKMDKRKKSEGKDGRSENGGDVFL